MFQEGQDPAATAHVRRSRPPDRGGLQHVDAGASARLAALLRAAAAYAAAATRHCFGRRREFRRAAPVVAECAECQLGVVSPSAARSSGVKLRRDGAVNRKPYKNKSRYRLDPAVSSRASDQAIWPHGRGGSCARRAPWRRRFGDDRRAALRPAGRVGLAAAVASMVANFASSKHPGGASPGFSDVGGASAHARDGPRSPAPAMLEMRLDHASGAMTGTILSDLGAARSKPCPGRSSFLSVRSSRGTMRMASARHILDRRFAGWREADQGQRQGRAGGRCSAGGVRSPGPPPKARPRPT